MNGSDLYQINAQQNHEKKTPIIPTNSRAVVRHWQMEFNLSKCYILTVTTNTFQLQCDSRFKIKLERTHRRHYGKSHKITGSSHAMSASCQRVVIQGSCVLPTRIRISGLEPSYKHNMTEIVHQSASCFVTGGHRLTSSVTKMLANQQTQE